VDIDLPPSAEITSHEEGDYVDGMVLIAGTASDDKGISLVELSFDNGASYVSATGTGNWEYSLNTAEMSADDPPARLYLDGALPIRLRVRDTSGYFAYDFLNLIVDNDGPIVSIINPKLDQSVNGFVPIVGIGSRVSTVNVRVESLDPLHPYDTGWVEASGSVVWSYVLDATDLAETDYQVSVQGFRDSPLTVGTVVTRTFNVDKTIPQVAFTAPASGTDVVVYLQDTVLFEGTAEDNNGIASVDVSFNGGVTWTPATGASPTWSISLDTNTLGDGIRTVVARAKDTTGLYATANIPVNIDNKPPEVAIVSPPSGSLATGVVTIGGTSFDAGGVQLVQLKVGDEVTWRTVNGTNNWTLDVDVSAMPNGPLTLTAQAIDMASAEGVPASISVYVDNSMPVFGAVAGISGGGYYRDVISLSGSVSDADAGEDLAAVRYKVGDAAFSDVTTFTPGAPGSGLADWTLELDTVAVTAAGGNGLKTVTLRVVDEWGGFTDAVYEVIFDNTDPGLAMAQPISLAEVSGIVNVTGSASDAWTLDYLRLRVKEALGAVWLVDGDILPSLSSGLWSFSWDTTALTVDTDYTIQVEARDRAGNATILERTVTRTDSVPSISILSPANGDYLKGDLVISGTADPDDAATVVAVAVTVDGLPTEYPVSTGDGFATWTVTLNTTDAGIDPLSLADGLHTFAVRVDTDTPATNSASVQLNIDNTPPVIAIESPPDEDPDWIGYGLVSIAGYAIDDNLSTVELNIDGSGFGSAGIIGLESFSYGWDTYAGVAGSAKDDIVLLARATDLAGNVTVSAAVTVDVHPHIDYLSKSSATRGLTPADSLVIYGSNFTAGSTVSFKAGAGTVAGTVTAWTADSITVDVPATATSGNLYVTTNGKLSNGVNLDIWQVITPIASDRNPWFSMTAQGNELYALSTYNGGAGNLYQALDRYDGGSWLAPVSLSASEKFTMTSSAVAVQPQTGADEVFVAWNNTKATAGMPLGVSLRRSVDGGAVFGARVTVTSSLTNFLSLGLHDPDPLTAGDTRVYLSGYDSASMKLMLYSSTDSGATWTPLELDAPAGGDVGRYASLGMYPYPNATTPTAWYPVIAYRDTTNLKLKLAYYNGVAWNVRTVDATGNVGDYAALDVDSSGGIHISYFNGDSGDLKYAYASSPGAIFSVTTPVSDGITGFYTDIDTDAGGDPHVIYYDFSRVSMMYAKRVAGVWETHRIPETLTYSFPANFTGHVVYLLLDASGKPRAHYPVGSVPRQASFVP